MELPCEKCITKAMCLTKSTIRCNIFTDFLTTTFPDRYSFIEGTNINMFIGKKFFLAYNEFNSQSIKFKVVLKMIKEHQCQK
jgi:hypothetical protein